MKSFVVVGIGNFLLSDDGVGVHAIRRLKEESEWDHIEWIDGGTIGLSLLAYLEEATHVLFIDAVQADEPPGALVHFDLLHEEFPTVLKMTAHEVNLQDIVTLLKLKKGHQLKALELIGIVPASLESGIELSPYVRENFEKLLELVRDRVQKWEQMEARNRL